MRRILLAVDGSEHSLRAAELAGQLSECLGATVDVLNVVARTYLGSADAIAEYERIEHVRVDYEALLRVAGDDVVRAAAAQVRDAGGTVGKEEVLVGRPAQEIAAFAEAVDADLVVMGRRGVGDVRGLLLGSVSHKVAHLTDRTLVTTQ